MSEPAEVIDTDAPADAALSVETAPQDTPEAADIEAEALAMGWKPPSEFRGDKDKFVSAEEYVKRGKEIMPFLRRELQQAYGKISKLEQAVQSSIKHISQADERAYTRAKAELEAELHQAATAGDAEAVKAITKDIVDLNVEVLGAAKDGDGEGEQPQSHPDFDAWRETAPWFGKDVALTAAFNAICEQVAEEGYTKPKAGLKEAERRLREEFPNKFEKPENPNRRNAPPVEGSGAGGQRGGKSYSDLPQDARAMCDEMVRDIKGMTREKWVASYFAREDRK